MNILLSPAKIMIEEPNKGNRPLFYEDSLALREEIKTWSKEEMKKRFKASEALNEKAYVAFHSPSPLGRALFVYSGIAYQYLDAKSLKEEELSYLQAHLCILSGLYGLLRPLDQIDSYRLMMGSRGSFLGKKDLYAFWGDRIAKELEDDVTLNLASGEYAKAVRPYLPKEKFIDVFFGEEENGKLVEKGVYAKMARGRMTRYLAAIQAKSIDDVKGFHELGYVFDEEKSLPTKLVFVKGKIEEGKKKLFEPDW